VRELTESQRAASSGVIIGPEVHAEAYERWGFDAQLHALGEELSEASAAIHRFYARKGSLERVMEELVDVESVLDSLRDALASDEDWGMMRQEKRRKLRAKLDAEVQATNAAQSKTVQT